MPELICHLFGDYILQNHWMALNKTRASIPCLVHVTLYTLPFFLLTRSPAAIAVIFATHFVIDRFSLAKRWPAFWGVGCEGWLPGKIKGLACEREINSQQCDRLNLAWPPLGDDQIAKIRESYAAIDPAPVWLAVWLGIIVDNTIHLLMNTLAIGYL